jgi:3-keto-5-aminohexanoate cleavage enzyme
VRPGAAGAGCTGPRRGPVPAHRGFARTPQAYTDTVRRSSAAAACRASRARRGHTRKRDNLNKTQHEPRTAGIGSALARTSRPRFRDSHERMSKPCIITVAITGSLPRKTDNPAVPISLAEQIESTQEAFEAGATLVHMHVRNDDGTPTSDPERFARLLEGVRRHCPGIVTQTSTGGRSGAGRERGAMLSLKPDMASLATGSVNFPTRVYDNPPELVDWLAGEMLRFGVKPEIEAFDLSMIFQAVAMQRAERINGPLHVQFVMGVKNAMPVDRDVFEFYVKTLARLAPDATWTGAGIGRDQLTLVRWSLELGGHCRTGFEDNVRLDRDTLAPSNAALVRQVVAHCAQYGRRPATVAEARQILRLPPAA